MCRNLTASHSTAVILQPTRLWWFQRVVLDADKSDLRLSRAVNDFSEKKKKKKPTAIRWMADQPSSKKNISPTKELDSRALWGAVVERGGHPDCAKLSDEAHRAAAKKELEGAVIEGSPSDEEQLKPLASPSKGKKRRQKASSSNIKSSQPDPVHVSTETTEPHQLQNRHIDDMPTSFKVKPLQGLQDGYEDPLDFIEDIETAVERDYARQDEEISTRKKRGEKVDEDEKALNDKKERDCRLLFRQNVSGRAETWLKGMSRDTRRDWQKLRASCLERYRLPEEDPVANIARMEAQYDSLKQMKDESIAAYLERPAHSRS